RSMSYRMSRARGRYHAGRRPSPARHSRCVPLATWEASPRSPRRVTENHTLCKDCCPSRAPPPELPEIALKNQLFLRQLRRVDAILSLVRRLLKTPLSTASDSLPFRAEQEREAAFMRVLVVEDDRALCEVFAEFLREVGHQPVVVHTAEAALDALRAERHEAMLLDICLPGMSGIDLLKLQVVRDLRVPTVVISGRATESQVQDCLRSGAFDFIGKPVALQRLAEVLGCLESRPSARPDAPPIERRRAPRTPVALPVRARE